MKNLLLLLMYQEFILQVLLFILFKRNTSHLNVLNFLLRRWLEKDGEQKISFPSKAVTAEDLRCDNAMRFKSVSSSYLQKLWLLLSKNRY